tara:strand:+ start:105 stop:311 length:207 start_codon:yes stop_codon:yes gene_type:complete
MNNLSNIDDKQFYMAITGLKSEDLKLDKNSGLDCMNCMKAIPEWVLEDAGDFIYLNEYDCENCGEPLG